MPSPKVYPNKNYRCKLGRKTCSLACAMIFDGEDETIQVCENLECFVGES